MYEDFQEGDTERRVRAEGVKRGVTKNLKSLKDSKSSPGTARHDACLLVHVTGGQTRAIRGAAMFHILGVCDQCSIADAQERLNNDSRDKSIAIGSEGAAGPACRFAQAL